VLDSRKENLRGSFQIFWCAFQGVVLAALHLFNALGVDVKANGGALFAKLHGEWQADLAEADDGDVFIHDFLAAEVTPNSHSLHTHSPSTSYFS
jgi:hypothetical protein